jgi:hypothetical protein
MNDKLPMVFHIRLTPNEKLSSKGGYTLVAVHQPDGTLRWGISKCHRNDNYCKRSGRTKAYGRTLSSSQYFSTIAMDYKKGMTVSNCIVNYLEASKLSFPPPYVIEEAVSTIK